MWQPHVATTSDSSALSGVSPRRLKGDKELCPHRRPRERLAALPGVGGRQMADSPPRPLHPARSPAPGSAGPRAVAPRWSQIGHIWGLGPGAGGCSCVFCQVQRRRGQALSQARLLSQLLRPSPPSADFGQNDCPSGGLTALTCAVGTCTCAVLSGQEGTRYRLALSLGTGLPAVTVDRCSIDGDVVVTRAVPPMWQVVQGDYIHGGQGCCPLEGLLRSASPAPGEEPGQGTGRLVLGQGESPSGPVCTTGSRRPACGPADPAHRG